jgi:lipopolysaccharide/colanic/teichoic acid biosynthesis glycosyltransferase
MVCLIRLDLEEQLMEVNRKYSSEIMLLDEEQIIQDQSRTSDGSSERGEHYRKHKGFSLAAKRMFDAVGSAALLVLLCPVFFVVGVVNFLDDGWPIFYRRRVVGRKGSFDAFKFRTMRRDADAILNANPALRAEFERNFKLKEDPRVTRFGALLRKSSLDELPQLLNILRGEMSFVGPRMITAPELEKYGAFKASLLSVSPGLTGYWQVNGRQEVDYVERVRMDMHYIQNWNIWLDLKILLLTPITVLRRKGAY